LSRASTAVVQFNAGLYIKVMTATTPDVGLAEARQHLAELIQRAEATREPVYVSRRGRRVVAIVDAEVLDRLTELAEDMIDIREAEQARREMADTRVEPIPWDEVKAELGLT
jgi:prevent-host-death family protein